MTGAVEKAHVGGGGAVLLTGLKDEQAIRAVIEQSQAQGGDVWRQSNTGRLHEGKECALKCRGGRRGKVLLTATTLTVGHQLEAAVVKAMQVEGGLHQRQAAVHRLTADDVGGGGGGGGAAVKGL